MLTSHVVQTAEDVEARLLEAGEATPRPDEG